MISGGEILRWLGTLGLELPAGLSEEACEALAERPGDSIYSELVSVDLLVLHHSATETGAAAPIRALHRGVFGWDDIGYHYVIGNGTMTADGLVEEGRPEWAVGAHSRGNNERSLGICLVGHLSRAHATDRQMKAAVELVRDILGRYDLGPDAVRLHRQMPGNSTECPGDNLPLSTVLETLR